MAITLGLVEAIDSNGVYVSMPGSRGVLRGPYKALSTVAAGTTVLVASTDDGEQLVVGAAPGDMGAVSVLSFGARGDDVSDDTAAVQAAVDAAIASGGVVTFPPGVYKVTSAITVNGPVTLTGTGTIHQTASAHGLVITGDGVTVEGLTLTGRHSGAVSLDVDEDAIRAFGASAASPLSRLTVRTVTISGWGMYGVNAKWVDGFAVTGCDISRIGYAGVLATSALNGTISGNRISDVGPGSSGNMYGVALSREETDSLLTDPHCADVVVSNNIVSGIAWEGLDTHGGLRITFTGNMIRDCYVGIAVGESDNSSNDGTWAPKDVVVSNNVIDSSVDDGSAGYGVTFVGAPGATSADPATDYATGVVSGNVIRGHGTESSSTSGAIYVRNTEGLVVSGNVIERPSPLAVVAYYDNRGLTCLGNAVTDVWSDTHTDPSAVGLLSDNNTGVMTGNVLRSGDKSATYLNVNGIRNGVGSAGGCDVRVGVNSFDATNFTSSYSGVQPEITGSRGGNAALSSLLTALEDLGLILDSSS